MTYYGRIYNFVPDLNKIYSFLMNSLKLIPEDIHVNIVYEDDDLLLVNKQPGMVVHPSYGHYSGTLLNALAYHLRDNKLYFL